MGIVSVILFAAGFGFLLALRRKINEVADREGDEDISWVLQWGARGCALLALVGVVGVNFDTQPPFPGGQLAGGLPSSFSHEPLCDLAGQSRRSKNRRSS